MGDHQSDVSEHRCLCRDNETPGGGLGASSFGFCRHDVAALPCPKLLSNPRTMACHGRFLCSRQGQGNWRVQLLSVIFRLFVTDLEDQTSIESDRSACWYGC